MATIKKKAPYEDFNLNEYLGGVTSSDDNSLTRSKIEEILATSKKAETVNNPMKATEPGEPTQQSEPAEKPVETETVSAKRISQKQRKASLVEYKNCFLNPPKITDRKTVYLSKETRDRLDEIVRRLGERGSSVSGFIENMAREHLEVYRDDIEQWKRL